MEQTALLQATQRVVSPSQMTMCNPEQPARELMLIVVYSSLCILIDVS